LKEVLICLFDSKKHKISLRSLRSKRRAKKLKSSKNLRRRVSNYQKELSRTWLNLTCELVASKMSGSIPKNKSSTVKKLSLGIMKFGK